MNWTMHNGEALEVLRTLPDESVQCCLSSPPYWGLRDYGNPNQIGLESSPDAFVAALVGVYREVKRVLADDGVCWLNLGDSYTGSGKARGGGGVGPTSAKQVTNVGAYFASNVPLHVEGCKPKDLIGIPWRVAFALQADGWYLRSDVIWAKPNPMPESVTDRPTKAHEYVFLLTKSERYAYNADAIREPTTPDMVRRAAAGHTRGAGGAIDASRQDAETLRGPHAMAIVDNGANARTVWSIPTEASPYEHFAVMPKALARKCILAGSAHGGVVLDPFAGVATTGVVALEEGRSFVGIELNPKYHAIARERLANVAPLLATEVSA